MIVAYPPPAEVGGDGPDQAAEHEADRLHRERDLERRPPAIQDQ